MILWFWSSYLILTQSSFITSRSWESTMVDRVIYLFVRAVQLLWISRRFFYFLIFFSFVCQNKAKRRSTSSFSKSRRGLFEGLRAIIGSRRGCGQTRTMTDTTKIIKNKGHALTGLEHYRFESFLKILISWLPFRAIVQSSLQLITNDN